MMLGIKLNMLSKEKLMFLSIIYTIFFTCEIHSVPCDKKMSIKIPAGSETDKNGDLRVNDQRLVFKKGQYFTDDKNNLRGCICEIKTCIRKCCGPSKMLFSDDEMTGCNETENVLTIQDVPFIDKETNQKNWSIIYDNYSFVFGSPCSGNYYNEREFSISRSGLLKEKGPLGNDLLYHDQLDYCIDKIVDGTGEISLTSLICFPQFEEKPPSGVSCAKELVYFSRIHKLLTVLFVIYFILVFFAYAVTPLLRNLPGVCLITQTSCLFIVCIAATLRFYFLTKETCCIFGKSVLIFN